MFNYFDYYFVELILTYKSNNWMDGIDLEVTNKLLFVIDLVCIKCDTSTTAADMVFIVENRIFSIYFPYQEV